MPIATHPLRNTLWFRADDGLLHWIDTARGQEDRSTFIRKRLQQAAVRSVLQKDADDVQD